MTPFHEFLNQLLNEGRVVFRSTRAPHDRPRPQDIAVLEKAYLAHGLSVAGPDIPFDPAVAFSAAELIRQASWALVNHDDRISHLKKCLTMPIAPVTPAHHLSADLTLRYLPQIFNRARVLDPCDPFVDLLRELLRRWPLSGAISDVAEAPLASLDFGGHLGLLLLYAERLAVNDRKAWRPAEGGPGWEQYELVIQERGRVGANKPDFSVTIGRGAQIG
jgi:MoxR-vWA-beta-propeller ternary system domain bpX4